MCGVRELLIGHLDFISGVSGGEVPAGRFTLAKWWA
jgi:hypothetical protein